MITKDDIQQIKKTLAYMMQPWARKDSRRDGARMLKIIEAAEAWSAVGGSCQDGSCVGDAYTASEILVGRGPQR